MVLIEHQRVQPSSSLITGNWPLRMPPTDQLADALGEQRLQLVPLLGSFDCLIFQLTDFQCPAATTTLTARRKTLALNAPITGREGDRVLVGQQQLFGSQGVEGQLQLSPRANFFVLQFDLRARLVIDDIKNVVWPTRPMSTRSIWPVKRICSEPKSSSKGKTVEALSSEAELSERT